MILLQDQWRTCVSSCLLRGDADASMIRLPLIMFKAGRLRGNGPRGMPGLGEGCPSRPDWEGGAASVYAGGGPIGVLWSDMMLPKGCIGQNDELMSTSRTSFGRRPRGSRVASTWARATTDDATIQAPNAQACTIPPLLHLHPPRTLQPRASGD